MKTLSVIIPSYNSENYLDQCMESLLAVEGDIEMIIINDGSMDRTQFIADEYAKQYPQKVKVIHQRNLGHGGAINTGISYASGHYIKVVDSDDWVNPLALTRVVKKLRDLILADEKLDMMICNFMYDKVGVSNKRIMDYKGILPEDKIFSWQDTGHFKYGKYMLMHSVIYSRDVLEQTQLKLPNHTFYVDNLFVFLPLVHVEKMFYMNECVYHYYIGRQDQSVNEINMMKRIDQQLLVNELLLESVDLKEVEDKKKAKYMAHYLNIVTTVSSILLIKIGNYEALNKKKMIWRKIKQYDFKLYLQLRFSLLGSIIHFPGELGRKITLFAYHKAQEKFGFN